MKELRLTQAEFLALPEYSATLPTGTTTGKRWRRLDGAHSPFADENRHPRWLIGEFGRVIQGGRLIEVTWYRPIIRIAMDEVPNG